MAGFKERNSSCTKNIADWDHSIKQSTWQIEKYMTVRSDKTDRARLMFKMPAYNCNFDLKGEKVKAYV